MKVSVVVVTYNHERFIDEALASVMAQQTDFDFEVIVSEDCSTDTTRSLVTAWRKKHPERIRLVLSDHNLRSNEVVARGFREARGEYVALLDGDDKWTFERKLQLQTDFLDTHPDHAMCFHDAEVIDESGRIVEPRRWTPVDQKLRSTLEDIWAGNFIATCSAMFRADIVRYLPSWYSDLDPMITDWPLHILSAEHGDIGYLPRAMAAYRLHSGGLYSPLATEQKLDWMHRFYATMNANTGYRHDAIVRRSHRRFFLDWAHAYHARGQGALARTCLRRSVGLGLPDSLAAAAEFMKMGLVLYAPWRGYQPPPPDQGVGS